MDGILQSKLGKDSTKPNVKDVYKHVSKVMAHIVKHCPHQGMEKIEEISWLNKGQAGIVKEEFLKMSVSNEYAKPSCATQKKNTEEFIKENKKHFVVAPKKQNEEGEELEEEALASIGSLPDLQVDAKIWQWAGINFGEYDIMLL